MASSIEIGDGAGGRGTSTVRIEIIRSGTNIGTKDSSLPVLVNSNSGLVSEYKDLASGDNTITLPSESRAVYIQPPTGNTNTITFKGAAGDTGRKLNKTAWSHFAFDTDVTNFILNAGAAITGVSFEWS